MALRGFAGLTRAQAAALLHPGYPSASFGWMAEDTTGSLAIPAADTVYLYSFRVYSPIVVNTVFNRTVTGGAGSSVKVAIWRNNYATARATGLPVIGSNTALDTTTSNQNDSFAVANVPLAAGVYWAGTKGTGTLPSMIVAQTGAVSRQVYATSIGAVPVPMQGYSVPDAFANDIMALDMTGATFTPVNTSGIPAIGLGWN